MTNEERDMLGIQRNWPDYTIEEVLGKGGYGVVYKIKREHLGNIIYSALKVIHIPPDEENREELRGMGMTEAQINDYYKSQVTSLLNENSVMERLKGASNVVTIEDCRVENDEESGNYTIYIKMELLESLDKILQTYTPSEDVIVKIAMDLCEALSACEKMNIIHRDIKLSNVFMNSFNTFKLGDFGIARQMESMKTRGMTQVGTSMYMAPELYATGKADHRADIYSLGIMLYRLANRGYFPFVDPHTISPEANQNAMMKRLMGEELPPLTGVDPELSRIIIKACEKDVDRRYQHAQELRKDLKKWENMQEMGESYKDYITNDQPVPAPPDDIKTLKERQKELEETIRQQQELLRIQQENQRSRSSRADETILIMPEQDQESERIARQERERTERERAERARAEQERIARERREKEEQNRFRTPDKKVAPAAVKPEKTKKSKKGLIIGGIAGVAVIAIIAVVMLFMGDKYKPGNIVEFGNYDGRKLEWIVLSKEGDRAYLVSKDLVDEHKAFNEDGSPAEWNESTLNDWLNSDFVGQCFDDDEKKAIDGTVGLLSVRDVGKYLTEVEDRKVTTEYGQAAWWWLQDSSEGNANAAYVDCSGQVSKFGGSVRFTLGVRPAIWINTK